MGDEDAVSDNFNPFSTRFAIEFEDCAEARGSCCGGGDDHEDNGLDSTLSISIKDEVDMMSEREAKSKSKPKLRKLSR